MIFIVVGTQEPFDRLIKYMDEWAGIYKYPNIIAQIAHSSYKPSNFEWFDFIPVTEFDNKFKQANLIVSHAGMGSILSALQYSKPIIVMPRLADLKEHRNDHQVATAKSFSKLGYVNAVYSKEELFASLNKRNEIKPVPPINHQASNLLLSTLQEFIYKNPNH